MSVTVESLIVDYGSLRAVDNVSFVAPTGQVTAVLGPNGAGKTSTIEVCEGFRRLSSGVVRVAGLDPIREHRQLVQIMGVMLQGGGVYPGSRVRDVIRHFCSLYDKGVDGDSLMEKLDLAHRSNSTWRKLSGGEQQRVSLALALAADPEVVFLDEPTSGVDVVGRDVIRAVIHDLASRGATVVLASHEMTEAERVASHVVMFKAGKVVASGKIAEVVRTRQRLTFQSSDSLVTAELAAHLGSVVVRVAHGTFEVAHTPTTDLVARITRWLAEHDLPLVRVDMGIESLEDAYRRLTGDEP